jgi:hypothetical protein
MGTRLKKYRGLPHVLGPEPVERKLKEQPSYGQTPWKPGERPSPRNYGRLPVYGGIDDKPQPYGEFFAVQKPANRGTGYSPIEKVDLEGRETKVKQVEKS